MAVEGDDNISEIIRAAASSLGYAEIRLLQETAVRAFVTKSDVFLPSYWWWQVAVLCSGSSRVRLASFPGRFFAGEEKRPGNNLFYYPQAVFPPPKNCPRLVCDMLQGNDTPQSLVMTVVSPLYSRALRGYIFLHGDTTT